jgi:hypothetical protein
VAVAADGTIDVADSLRSYELYAALHGQRLKVTTTGGSATGSHSTGPSGEAGPK